jgi:prenyltransferase beta subunit
LALKHAVHNISRLWAADWQDKQAALLLEAGEKAVQFSRTSLTAVCNKTMGKVLTSKGTILHLLPGLSAVAV